jgi:hypothetical protein
MDRWSKDHTVVLLMTLVTGQLSSLTGQADRLDRKNLRATDVMELLLDAVFT